MRMQARLEFLVVSLALVAGCTGTALPRYHAPGGEPPRWPPPPLPARVAWEGGWSGGYVRPHGIAVGAHGAVCIADPGAGVTWLQEPDRRPRPLGEGVLASPVGCAVRGDGSVLVTDSVLGAVLAFSRRGKELWRTPRGAVGRPTGIALLPGGKAVVADTTGHRLVFLDAAGRATRVVGRRGEGPGEFNAPTALAVGPGERIHVVDALNFRVQVLDRDGHPLGTIGRVGDGPGTFSRPRGVAVDRAGRIFVTDAVFDNVQVFDDRGRLLLAFGRQGRGPGQFWMPAGIAATGDGRILVVDAYNRRVQVFRELAPEDAPR